MSDNQFIGVFGYGRFGKFLCEELRRIISGRIPIRVYDPIATRDAQAAPKFAETWSASHAAKKSRTELDFVSATEAARGAVVIFAIPISEMKAALLQAAPFMTEGAIIMDTCSVKTKPVELMKLLLPGHVEILGTHPLFGPDSARANRGIRGLRVVLCPVRISTDHLTRLRSMIEGAGLKVIEATPEQHDRAMAETQGLFHLIARTVEELQMESPETREIVTPGPARLFEDLKILEQDSVQLFQDIQRENPFARDVRKRFIEKLTELDRSLDES